MWPRTEEPKKSFSPLNDIIFLHTEHLHRNTPDSLQCDSLCSSVHRPLLTCEHSVRTYSEHLHEQLLLLLLGLVLSIFVDLVAIGGQEAVVVVEED